MKWFVVFCSEIRTWRGKQAQEDTQIYLALDHFTSLFQRKNINEWSVLCTLLIVTKSPGKAVVSLSASIFGDGHRKVLLAFSCSNWQLLSPWWYKVTAMLVFTWHMSPSKLLCVSNQIILNALVLRRGNQVRQGGFGYNKADMSPELLIEVTFELVRALLAFNCSNW